MKTNELFPWENTDPKDMDGEIWIDCVGFDGYYSVSNLGRVKSEPRWVNRGKSPFMMKGRILKQYIKLGAVSMQFSIDGIITRINVPALVGSAFIRETNSGEVYCHKNKLQYDNRVENIMITSYSESTQLGYKLGVNWDWGIGSASSKSKDEYLKKFGIYENGVLVAKICVSCMREIPIEDYNRNEGDNRYRKCKDCIAKRDGVIDIGKHKRESDLNKSGLQTCSVCKEIKSIDTDFPKNKYRKSGISKNCKVCNKKLHKEYIKKQNSEFGDFYVKQYALRVYGLKKTTDTDIEKYRNEIKEKNKPKYFIDGLEFKTRRDFGRYIEKKYKIKCATVERRLENGFNEQDCTIPNNIFRSNGIKKSYELRKIKN